MKVIQRDLFSCAEVNIDTALQVMSTPASIRIVSCANVLPAKDWLIC